MRAFLSKEIHSTEARRTNSARPRARRRIRAESSRSDDAIATEHGVSRKENNEQFAAELSGQIAQRLGRPAAASAAFSVGSGPFCSKTSQMARRDRGGKLRGRDGVRECDHGEGRRFLTEMVPNIGAERRIALDQRLVQRRCR